MSFDAQLRESLTHQVKLNQLIQIIMSGGARLEHIYSDSPQLRQNLHEILRLNQTDAPIFSYFLDQWRQNLEQECQYLESKGKFDISEFGKTLLLTINAFSLEQYQPGTQEQFNITPAEQKAPENPHYELSPEEYLKLLNSFIKLPINLFVSNYSKLRQTGFSFDELCNLAQQLQAEQAIEQLVLYSTTLLEQGYTLNNLLRIAKSNPTILKYLTVKTANILNYLKLDQIAEMATFVNAVNIFEKLGTNNRPGNFFTKSTLQAIMDMDPAPKQSLVKIAPKTMSSKELDQLKRTLPAIKDWYINPQEYNLLWVAPQEYGLTEFNHVITTIGAILKHCNSFEGFKWDRERFTIAIPKKSWSSLYAYHETPQTKLKQEDLILYALETQNYVYYLPDKIALVCNSPVNSQVNGNYLKFLWDNYVKFGSSTQVIATKERWVEISPWQQLFNLLFPPKAPVVMNFFIHHQRNEINYYSQPQQEANPLNIAEEPSDDSLRPDMKPF